MSKKNYIDDDAFYQKMVEWKESEEFKKELEENGRPKPPDDMLVNFCYKIINNYTQQRKWFNVDEELLEESKSLAIEFCIKYLHNFDHKKYKKPFTYVTQMAHNAILQTFNKDKKEKMNRLSMLTSTLSSSTYIRSDGEIDLIAQGDYAKNNIRYLEGIMKDYEND